jgi:protein MpaA
VREPDDVRIRIVVAVAVVAALALTSCAENEPETAITESESAVDADQPAPTIDAADPVATIDPAGPVSTIDAADPVETIDPAGAVSTIDAAPDLPIGGTIPTPPATADELYELRELGGLDDVEVDTEVVIGRSVEDRPITVVRRGTAGGTKVLVVGVIHGDEDAGADILDVLRLADVPDGVELWLVRSMNPDGQFHQVRHNANGVDLNRNFAHNWGPVAEPGNWEYAGPAAASEPETRAMSELGAAVRPDLVLWYHQDLFRISPAAGRDGEIRARYAGLTGLPLVAVTGGTYTGTASQWSRTVVEAGGVGFTIELGPTLSRDDVIRHADAVLTIASEM